MRRPRPHLIPLLLVLIGCVGVGISIYLTAVHYAHVPLVCTSNGVVNCERVLSSGYSSVGGIPVSTGGLLWFALTGVMGAIALFRVSEPAWLQPAQVFWSFLGLLTVLYLVGVEVLALGVICAWCTSLHVLIVLALVLSILRSPSRGDAGPVTQAAGPRRPSSSLR